MAQSQVVIKDSEQESKFVKEVQETNKILSETIAKQESKNNELQEKMQKLK